MDAALRGLIAQLHPRAPRYVLAATGGGAAAIGHLLGVPGGSGSLLEAIVPYDEHALCDFLRRVPESFCSAATAQEMARRAWERACWLTSAATVAGIGCTASLRSDRPKRGDHRFHIAIHTTTSVRSWSLTLAKEQREREGEEEILDSVLLNAMAEVFGLSDRLPVPLLPGEAMQTDTVPTADRLEAFLAGSSPVLCCEPDGRLRTDAPRPGLLLPGSFNPLHHGHCGLAEGAERITGRPAAFELSVANADKPPLASDEVRRRRVQFLWRAPLWLTQAPTFVEKARLFPGAIFVVGSDTAERIVQPRFYGDSEEAMATALAEIRQRQCRFLVAGRVDATGCFRALDQLTLPPQWRDLFTPIPAEAFRIDISSTQLREQATAASR
jgi:nicotinic acid mononucleotide adenylyltransferase